MSDLILASASPYRRKQLRSIGLEIDAIAANIDETPNQKESPETLSKRLALEKAQAISTLKPDAIVIGSDQVAHICGAPQSETLGKPGNYDNAFAQLSRLSGQSVNFYTSVALVCKQRNIEAVECEITCVQFRHLSELDIARYLKTEQPFDCAGSFKSEGLGILLFEQIQSRDPNGLIGLPLMLLRDMLWSHCSVDVLTLATR